MTPDEFVKPLPDGGPDMMLYFASLEASVWMAMMYYAHHDGTKMRQIDPSQAMKVRRAMRDYVEAFEQDDMITNLLRSITVVRIPVSEEDE